MKKLFIKNEVVRFKNEEQKKQLLDIAVKYGIKWYSGEEPFEFNTDSGNCINFGKGECLFHGTNKAYKRSSYKVISTKKFLKRFEEKQESGCDNAYFDNAHKITLHGIQAIGRCRRILPAKSHFVIIEDFDKVHELKDEVAYSNEEKQESGWFKGNREEDKRLYYINREENTFFGIDGNNDKWIVRNDASDITNVVKATNEEVLPRLIEEAKKRGLVGGVNIKCLIDSKEYRPNSEYYISGNNLNSLTLNQKVIMKKGIWAEVVEETKTTFKPVFMKCTQDQFDRMRPKLESVGCVFKNMNNFSNSCCWLINDFCEPLRIDVFESGTDLRRSTEVHTEAEFLEACGYVEEVYEPKVGDFGLFWDDHLIDNTVGNIIEIKVVVFKYQSDLGGYKNFTPLPKETEDIYNRIKNK